MGLFWSSAPAREVQPQPPTYRNALWGLMWSPSLRTDSTSKHRDMSLGISQCPVHTKYTPAPSSESSAKCPVNHSDPRLNPLNNMPALKNTRLPGQKTDLPADRTISSIPRGKDNGEGNWEYPSPQQMLNAMVRKSGSSDDIPEDAVESMVAVHNFLNEGVWNEVLEWEKPYADKAGVHPRLLRFTGRPHDLSPRARLIHWAGKVWPSKFGAPLPFDRHDWTVLRPSPDGQWQEVRYVIDFYEAPDEGDAPAFSVDVRPAIDSMQAVSDRVKHFAGPLWEKGMGRA